MHNIKRSATNCSSYNSNPPLFIERRESTQLLTNTRAALSCIQMAGTDPAQPHPVGRRRGSAAPNGLGIGQRSPARGWVDFRQKLLTFLGVSWGHWWLPRGCSELCWVPRAGWVLGTLGEPLLLGVSCPHTSTVPGRGFVCPDGRNLTECLLVL